MRREALVLGAALLTACSSSETSEGPTPDPGPRCDVGAAAEPGVVALDAGLVRGVKEGATWVFRGVPYVAPPVGALRFRAPEPAACWEGVRDAAAFGPACPQIDPDSGAVVGEEDCLTLNVWAPEALDQSEASRPVMVFLHGGGNIQGSSRQLVGTAPIYNGLSLSEAGGAVVVTLNYRLGPLGFLALPELSADSGKGRSGNYGLLDQIAALQWVQQNIKGFGGNPNRVMLFGESAGGLDACTLYASPLAADLFHAVLVESGGTTSTPLAEAEAALGARVSASSCGGAADRLACLRGLSAAEVVAELPGSIGIGGAEVGLDPAKYGPVVDGHVLPEATLDAITAGHQNRMPFVVGTNGDELARILTEQVATATEYESAVTQAFGAIAQDVLGAYPVGDYASPQEALVAVYSDLRFNCPARHMAEAAWGSQEERVWRYFFTRRATTPNGPAPAAHGIELLYVFHTLTEVPFYTPASEDLALSNAMMGYWTRFAATGDPNGGEAPAWPAYGTGEDAHIVLDSPITSGEGVRSAQCDFWDAALGL